MLIGGGGGGFTKKIWKFGRLFFWFFDLSQVLNTLSWPSFLRRSQIFETTGQKLRF